MFYDLFKLNNYYNSFINEDIIVEEQKHDGESLEDFSYRVYGRRDYWIYILLCGNNLSNIYESWDSLEVVRYIGEKYIENYLAEKRV